MRLSRHSAEKGLGLGLAASSLPGPHSPPHPRQPDGPLGIRRRQAQVSARPLSLTDCTPPPRTRPALSSGPGRPRRGMGGAGPHGENSTALPTGAGTQKGGPGPDLGHQGHQEKPTEGIEPAQSKSGQGRAWPGPSLPSRLLPLSPTVSPPHPRGMCCRSGEQRPPTAPSCPEAPPKRQELRRKPSPVVPGAAWVPFPALGPGSGSGDGHAGESSLPRHLRPARPSGRIHHECLSSPASALKVYGRLTHPRWAP